MLTKAVLIVTIMGVGSGSSSSTGPAVSISDVEDFAVCKIIVPQAYNSAAAAYNNAPRHTEVGFDVRCVDKETGQTYIVTPKSED